MGPQNQQNSAKTNPRNLFRESYPAHCLQRRLSSGIYTDSGRSHLTKTLLFTARQPYSHIHGLGQVLSTFVVQKDDPEASFEPLLHPCGTQKTQKCTPRTKVKKRKEKNTQLSLKRAPCKQSPATPTKQNLYSLNFLDFSWLN